MSDPPRTVNCVEMDSGQRGHHPRLEGFADHAVEQMPGEETKEKADEEFLAAFNDNLEEFSNACLK